MQISDAKRVHGLMAEEKWVEAGNEVLRLANQKPVAQTIGQGKKLCWKLFQKLLDEDMYLHAAVLQWGEDMFQGEATFTKRVFKAIDENNLTLLMGSASCSKTYSAGGWLVLDYLRDPYYTTVKLGAVSEDHLKKNLFAHVAKLMRACAIQPPFEVTVQDAALWIGIKAAGYEFGISGVAFKQSQETSGNFKGYKTQPVRKTKHHRFGVMSRLRILFDEGQNIPYGPYQDLNSPMGSISGRDSVKIIVAFNPENVNSHVVKLAEPQDGWQEDQVETLYDYESAAGWTVCRLDAARCENVVQRKVIFPGLQTYEGYLSYLKGGDSSARYMTFARGFPPIKGSINTIIPPAWPQSQRGTAMFIDNPVTLAAADLAFMGRDSAQMAVARWGLASGWRDHTGKFHVFEDRLNPGRNKPRHVLQIEQILPMAKHDDTIKMAQEIIGRCRMMEIRPEWLAVDRTSIGLGTYDYLTRYWGPVFGIAWNEGATDRKILNEDSFGAEKQVDGVMSEMWWAFRRWLDPTVNAIVISPLVPSQPLNTQLTSRRFSPATKGKGVKVESKDMYKARNGGVSPDESDSIIMLVHLVRKNSDILPGQLEQSQPAKISTSDAKFKAVKDMISIESDDSISTEPKDDDV